MATDGSGDAGTDGTGGSEATIDAGMRRLARVGAVASLLLAIVVFAPAVLVTGVGRLLGDYFTAGPFGLTAVGFLAVVGVVVFLSAAQAHTDTLLLAGIALVVAVASLVLAVVWVVLLDTNVLFSFPTRFSWLEYHRWAVVVVSVAVAVAGAALARRVL